MRASMAAQVLVRLGLLALIVAQAGLAAAQSDNATDPGLIRVVQGKFVDEDCNEYLFTGWNGWRLLDFAANKATPSGFSSGQEYIRNLFAQAAALDLRVVRFFASSDNGGTGLMSSPTTFNEDLAVGMDVFLDEASKAGVKAAIALINLWKDDGVPQFEKWCGTDSINRKPQPDLDPRPETVLNATERLQDPYDWYMREDCRQQVKDYYSAVVNRRNTINGRLYKEDPTIFSWNLINEPRCKYCGPEAIDQWVADLAQHMKSVDPNHLVTVGEEGFFDVRDPLAPANPDVGDQVTLANGLPNHAYTGQDFIPNHASPHIDCAAFHLWPDNWGNKSLGFGARWIDAHIAAAKSLGKALVLEEFGKGAYENEIATVRDPWFALAYGAVENSTLNGGPLRATLFWQWDSAAQGTREFSSLVRATDSTFTNYIDPYAQRVADAQVNAHRSGTAFVAGCVPLRVQSSSFEG